MIEAIAKLFERLPPVGIERNLGGMVAAALYGYFRTQSSNSKLAAAPSGQHTV